MENAIEALYMSAAVLLLLIALTVSISSFTKVKNQVEEIVNLDETIDMAKESDSADAKLINYYQKNSNGSLDRIVGADTVITSIRRMQRENYTVYISGSNATDLASNRDNGNVFQAINWTDDKGAATTYLKLSISGTQYKNLQDWQINQIYEKIKNHTYIEKIGIYQEKTGDGVSSVNKQTHRIITYIENS